MELAMRALEEEFMEMKEEGTDEGTGIEKVSWSRCHV